MLIPVRYPVTEIPATEALVVNVDPIWYGQTMTSPDAGIVHSRSAFQPKASFEAASDEVIL
jgi:hypothetical protein